MAPRIHEATYSQKRKEVTMSNSQLLAGTFDQALTLVAERAVASRACGGFVKRADFDWKQLLSDATSKGQDALSGGKQMLSDAASQGGSMLSDAWANPHIRRSLIGAGVGAGLGGISSLASGRKQTLSDILAGGLMGGAVGGGGSLAYENLLKPNSEAPAEAATSSPDPAMVEQAGKARQELGILGAPQGHVQRLLKNVELGEKPEAAAGELSSNMPGMGEQLRNIPSAMGTALSGGRPEQALAQADFPGFKNLGLNATTLGAGGAAAAAAAAPSLLRAGANRFKKDWQSNRLADAWDRHGINQFLADPNKAGDLSKLLGTGPGSQAAADALNMNTNAGARLGRGDANLAFKGQTFDRNTLRDMANNLAKNRATARAATLEAAPGVSGMLRRGFNRGGRAVGPLLAGMVPLAMHEWGNHGYRSGQQPFMDLAQANATLYPQQQQP